MSDGIATTLTPEAAKTDAMSKAQRKAHEAFTKAASTAAKGLEAAGTAMVDALKAGCHAALSLAPRTYMTQVLTAAGMARSSADAAAAMAFVLWQAPEAQGIPAEGLRILARVAKGKDPAEVATAIRGAVRAARAKAHDRADGSKGEASVSDIRAIVAGESTAKAPAQELADLAYRLAKRDATVAKAMLRDAMAIMGDREEADCSDE
jgi:hypothetical protein